MDKKNIAGLLLLTALLASCASLQPTPADQTDELTPVVLMLDWVPNTNHVGLFVADELGYFQEAGLQVEIIEPGEVFAEQAVIGGVADFGISFQEQVGFDRSRYSTQHLRIRLPTGGQRIQPCKVGETHLWFLRQPVRGADPGRTHGM